MGRKENLQEFIKQQKAKSKNPDKIKIGTIDTFNVGGLESTVPTLHMTLDDLIGGFQRGIIMELYGEESAAKSTTVGKLIENLAAFRPDDEEQLSVLYVDAEGTFGTKFIKRFKNLKKDDMIIYKEHIIEDLWENVEAMIDAQALDILVIDSIGALQTNQESEKTMDESTVAALPKKLNTMIKKFYKATEESKLTVIVMNSEYTNIQTFGSYGPKNVLKGGQSLKYGKSVSLELKKSYSKTNATIETINGEEVMTEVMIEYTAKKNKLGAPMRSASTMLNVNREVRQTFKYALDVINYATKFGIIEKAGAWFKATVNGEEKKFQAFSRLIGKNC